MRARPYTVLWAVAALLTILCLRRYVSQLVEVGRTYATFHSLIRRHPDLLYQYPAPAEEAEAVPRLIHQVALGSGDFSKYHAAIQSCQQLNPGWTHQLWTDENATAFISEHYPDILPHYTGYFQNIQRANTLRYALLHRLGGVYLDLDISCHVPFESSPVVALPFVSPGAYPAGVNNAFIAARPNHPLLSRLLESVPSHDMYWGLPMRIPYVENMMSTGCMFFSNQWMSYVRDLLAGRQDERVFILADEQGAIEPHMLRGKVTTPLFTHGGSSSWHSWDAAMIIVIGKHYRLVAALVSITVVSTIGLVVYLCTRSRRRARLRRKNWTSGLTRKIWYPAE